ncbi:MAG TPA: AzlD domain-containing protein [Rhizobiaceae bacterium]|nr:AzlD domain-containing protein [Rhizobiaceae bacterium]
MNETVAIILAGAAATYLTRVGGHLVLSRIKRVPPRVEAGLNAVPAAVLTTLVAPAAVFEGPAETLTLLIAALLALRLPMLPMFFIGGAVIVALRAVMG